MKKWLKGILNFIQVNIGFGFDVPAKEALQYFSSKGLKPSFSYVDVFREEHASAFTVAKMMDMDLLKDVQDSLHAALAEGLSFDSWKERIVPSLQANGWWGRQAVYDPVTKKTIVSQLGSPHRLEVIFRTNMQMAYSVGQWQQIMQQAEQAPYLMYDAVDDYRTRPQHRAWDNIVLRVDNPWWRTHYPPNGWLCRCGVIQLSDSDLEVMGLSVSDTPRITYSNWQNPRTGINQKIPEGIDPGFNYNPGILRYDELQKVAKEKAVKLPDNLRVPAQQSLKQVTKEAKKPVDFDVVDGIPVAEQRRIVNDWIPEYERRTYPAILGDSDIATTAKEYGLSIEEQMALRYYTDTGHGVNFYLLETAPYNKKRYDIEQDGADLLNQALSKLPNHEGVVVSRMTLPNSFLKKMQEGAELLFPAFTSADDEADVFPSRKHRLIIKSKTGKKIRWISEHADAESEVLFGSPTWFKVNGVEQKEDGEIWFHMSEVDE